MKIRGIEISVWELILYLVVIGVGLVMFLVLTQVLVPEAQIPRHFANILRSLVEIIDPLVPGGEV